MPIKRIDDIYEDRRKREKEKFKKELTDDTAEVLTDIFKAIKKDSPLKSSKLKPPKKWWQKIIIWTLILFAFMLILNLLLVNVWLLKFFIKDLI